MTSLKLLYGEMHPSAAGLSVELTTFLESDDLSVGMLARVWHTPTDLGSGMPTGDREEVGSIRLHLFPVFSFDAADEIGESIAELWTQADEACLAEVLDEAVVVVSAVEFSPDYRDGGIPEMVLSRMLPHLGLMAEWVLADAAELDDLDLSVAGFEPLEGTASLQGVWLETAAPTAG